jgi:heme-degrading monooxygenase HmoA
MLPTGHHLAELNIGRLIAPTDDPRVAEFMAALDRVNGLGKRMPGFVWMMEGSGEPGRGNTENNIGDDPQMVANLTVWESVETLENFVWNTVHRQFYERRREWFEVLGAMHFVMWWVPAGHRPTLDEGLARLEHLRAHGDSDFAFGWKYLKDAQIWKQRACTPLAAE